MKIVRILACLVLAVGSFGCISPDATPPPVDPAPVSADYFLRVIVLGLDGADDFVVREGTCVISGYDSSGVPVGLHRDDGIIVPYTIPVKLTTPSEIPISNPDGIDHIKYTCTVTGGYEGEALICEVERVSGGQAPLADTLEYEEFFIDGGSAHCYGTIRAGS